MSPSVSQFDGQRITGDQRERHSVLSLIPARGGSKGIPGKNIRDLGGVPLIGWACRVVIAANLEPPVISTDCPKIATVASAFGGTVPGLRPAELAADDTPTLDVVRYEVRQFEARHGRLPNSVLLIQPTSPFRTASDLTHCLSHLQRPNVDSVVSVGRVPTHFAAQWQFHEDDDGLRPAVGRGMDNIPTRRQSLRSSFIRNGAIYGVRTESLLRRNSLFGDRCVGYEMPTEASVNLDTMDDWRQAESLIASGRVSLPHVDDPAPNAKPVCKSVPHAA